MDIENNIKKISNEIKSTEVSFKSSQPLYSPVTKENIENLDNSAKYIYVISGDKTKNADYEMVFNDIRKNRAGIKLPRVNTKDDNNKCLYIGTSKNIRTRLKQHFIENNNKSTYSLHIYLWNSDNQYFKNIKIHLYSFQCDLDLIKVIESRLYKKYNPLFGSGEVR